MPKPRDSQENVLKWNVIRKEATKRNPLYRQEFEAAFQSFREKLPEIEAGKPDRDLIELFQIFEEGQKLCQRWGLSFALHPDDEQLWDCSPKDAPYFFKEPGYAVQVIPYQHIKSIQIFSELTPEQRVPLEDYNNPLKDYRYLRVRIDLHASKGHIKEEITDLVERWQDYIIAKLAIREFHSQESPSYPPDDLPVKQWIAERTRQLEQKMVECRKQIEQKRGYRRRGLSTDIELDEEPPDGPVTMFEVWDMHIGGKSAWSIVKELYPEIRGKSPNDYSDNFDKKAKRLLRSIERAIEAANNHIKSVTPE